MTGAAAGGLYGAAFGGLLAIPGAIIGGVVGAAEGIVVNVVQSNKRQARVAAQQKAAAEER